MILTVFPDPRGKELPQADRACPANCGECPFARDRSLGMSRLICTAPHALGDNEVVRSHHEPGTDCRSDLEKLKTQLEACLPAEETATGDEELIEAIALEEVPEQSQSDRALATEQAAERTLAQLEALYERVEAVVESVAIAIACTPQRKRAIAIEVYRPAIPTQRRPKRRQLRPTRHKPRKVTKQWTQRPPQRRAPLPKRRSCLCCRSLPVSLSNRRGARA